MTFLLPAGTVLAEIDKTELATVVISGVGIVLLVLIVLILVFYAFGTLVSKSEQLAAARKAKKAQKTVARAETEQAAAPETAPQIVSPSAPAAGDALVAVISAAVAAQEQGGHFVIKSIKKKSTRGGNAWARAAVSDNTRPF